MSLSGLSLACTLLATVCGSAGSGHGGLLVRSGTTQLTDPVGPMGTAAVESDGFPQAETAMAHLVAVRAASHDGFDRVVLEFDGDRMPSYRVAHVDPPIVRSGSGAVVPVTGEAFVELRLTPASAVDLSGDRPRRTYPGPDRMAPTGSVVTEVVETGDFEGTLAWTVGLRHRSAFAVTAYAHPPRLVVDIAQAPAGADLRPVGEPNLADKATPGSGGPVVVTDVRLGAHRGFDRIVIEVAGGGQVGWYVGYTCHARGQGTGIPLNVPGRAILALALTNVAYPREAPEGVWPWDGPKRQAIDGTAVVDTLVEDSLYEGRYAFFAGLNSRQPFAVRRLSAPQRVVIDILTGLDGR